MLVRTLLMVVVALQAYGYASYLSASPDNYAEQLQPLLRTLTESATCREQFAPRSEFETTASYERRLQQYAVKAEHLLFNSREAFNARNRRTVSIRFSLEQGEYNADASVYVLRPREHLYLFRGISIVSGEPYLTVSHSGPRGVLWFSGVGLKADPTLARTLRSREQGMQAVIFFELSALARRAARSPYSPGFDWEPWRHPHSIGLVLVPYRLEVRDPAEANHLVFSAEIRPGVLDDLSFIWAIDPGKPCGITN